MNKDQGCWELVSALIADGDRDGAIAMCRSEKCSSVCNRCQAYLGWAHYSKDELREAKIWFSLAAEAGNEEALYGIATTELAMGEYPDAIRSFFLAREKGYTRSYYWLGVIYESGLGVDKSPSTAMSYYQMGARCGYLAAERAYIRFLFKDDSLAVRVSAVPRLFWVTVKTAYVAMKNLQDERLADIRST